MKIIIDASKAVNEKAGIARYTKELCMWLPKLYPEDDFFYYFNFISGAKQKKQQIKKIVSEHKNVKYKIISLPGQVKEYLYPRKFCLSNILLPKAHLAHATEFLSYDIAYKIPQILTVHDLTMLKFPQHRGKAESTRHANMLRNACQDAKSIIAVSQATKNDIIKYFKISPKKIDVIYQGTSDKFYTIKNKKNIKKSLQKFDIVNKYILFVGTIEPRKNIKNLIRAYELFAKTDLGKSYDLVLAGNKGWNSDDIYHLAQKSNFKQKIHFTGKVSDEDLLNLYNGATLFCYPSIYEGFGIPVLEAMLCSLPVITSNISSMPEVGGAAAEYINPKNYLDISQKIGKIIGNKQKLLSMSDASVAQAKKFSWKKCAKQTYGIYQKIYEKYYQK